MRVLKETLSLAVQGLGYLSAFLLWYLMFYIMGDLMGSQLYGTLFYMISTLLVICFFEAKNKIDSENKIPENLEKAS